MTERLPKALLLDLDNTILAFDDTVDNAWRAASDRFASRIDSLEAHQLLAELIKCRDWFWDDPELNSWGRFDSQAAHREIVAKAFDHLGLDTQDIANQIADWHTHEIEEALIPFPGAIETVARIRDLGVKLALITNGGDSQRRKVEKFDLAPLFDCIVIEGEFGVGKPDERVYLHALDQLKVLAMEAWMVGDDLERDVAAPQRLGIFSIWLNSTGAGLPKSSTVLPDRIIRDVSKLL